MKRCFLVLLCLSAACFITGCTPQTGEKQVAGDIEPITLDWYVNYAWFHTQWNDSLVARTITEQTGVEINFIVPQGNESAKMDSMISGGTLPDIITISFADAQVDELIAYGLVHPLNVLADQYDPAFWDVASPERVAWYTQKDGNLYCYPNTSYTPKDYQEHDNISSNQTFLVRQDLYLALDSPDMSTPEGFKQAVMDAAQQFPTVDGYPLIPIGAHEFTETGCNSFDNYLMNFLAVPFEKDGRSYHRYFDDEYIRWLKVFRELGAEGYLAPDIFVDKRVQMEEKTAQGRYFCMLYQRTDLANQQKALYAKDPESVYIAVDGPRNSNGDDHTLPGAGINGWTVTFISKNCAYPDRAIQLMRYMMGEEGQKLLLLGVEGVTYDVVDGKPIVREDIFALLNSDRMTYDAQYGADNTYWMLMDNVMQLNWQQALVPPLAQPELWTYPYTIYTAQYDTKLELASEEANINTKIMQEWGTLLPKLLMAETEAQFDALLSAYMDRCDELGLSRLLDERTRQMQENKVRLGLDGAAL